MSDIQIIRRKLNNEEIDIVFKEMKESPNFVGYKKTQLEKFDEVYIAMSNNQFAGFGQIDFPNKDWVELDLLLIVTQFRGKGYGKILFNFMLNEAEETNKNIFLISRNPIVVSWAVKNKFSVKKNIWELPWPLLKELIIWFFNWYQISQIILKSIKFRKRGKWLYFIKYREISS